MVKVSSGDLKPMSLPDTCRTRSEASKCIRLRPLAVARLELVFPGRRRPHFPWFTLESREDSASSTGETSKSIAMWPRGACEGPAVLAEGAGGIFGCNSR